MALGKTAGCVILAALAASAAQFTVRHKHLYGGCTGILTVDADGVRFAGAKGHFWTWNYPDIQQLRLEPRDLHILTYKDRKLKLGADQAYDFTGRIPSGELFSLLRDHMDQRFIAAVEPPANGFEPAALWSVALSHSRRAASLTPPRPVMRPAPGVTTTSRRSAVPARFSYRSTRRKRVFSFS